jgi:two-component system LytT family sensor kinase
VRTEDRNFVTSAFVTGEFHLSDNKFILASTGRKSRISYSSQNLPHSSHLFHPRKSIWYYCGLIMIKMDGLELERKKLETIEFWVVTALFAYSMFVLLTPNLQSNMNGVNAIKNLYAEANVPFQYYLHYLIPTIIRCVSLFIAFLFLNFRLAPKLLVGPLDTRTILKAIVIVASVLIMSLLTNILLKQYLFQSQASDDVIYQAIWSEAFLKTISFVLACIGYWLLKYLGLFLISRAQYIQSTFYIFNRDNIIVFVFWVGTVYAMLLNETSTEFRFAWSVIVPSGIVLHGLSFFKLIPSSLKGRYPLASYFIKVFIFCGIAWFLVSMFLVMISDDEELGFSVGLFNAVFQFLIVAPFLWFTFQRQMKGNEQLYALRTELGRSLANLDFLRSQINPHFLFNALNTIYSLSLQEKAERTSEAVEKLGDMMRFMLLENTQDKISLTREIDYLENYIGLQRLRTDTNPQIQIHIDIQNDVDPSLQIAPMFLIPFVENAFKHGISLRHSSHVKVSLEIKENSLYFDVNNSKHVKTDNDPEKHKNGIGLVNVRQRLEHVYPRKHELLVRETSKEFFVHLKIELK